MRIMPTINAGNTTHVKSTLYPSDMIQAVSSLEYLESAPEGMDGGAWDRLKASYRELRELIDEDIPMIAR